MSPLGSLEAIELGVAVILSPLLFRLLVVVAVAALPVQLELLPLTLPVTFPVTFPVTLPVTLPVKLPINEPKMLLVTIKLSAQIWYQRRLSLPNEYALSTPGTIPVVEISAIVRVSVEDTRIFNFILFPDWFVIAMSEASSKAMLALTAEAALNVTPSELKSTVVRNDGFNFNTRSLTVYTKESSVGSTIDLVEELVPHIVAIEEVVVTPASLSVPVRVIPFLIRLNPGIRL